MTINELEELYKEALTEGGQTFDETAEKMTDELTPKELVKLAVSDAKSLHWTPEGNELSVHEAIRNYFYEYLTEMGEQISDPYLKVDPDNIKDEDL